MTWTVAGMTEQELANEPWRTLAFMPRSEPVILSISELLEPVDYDLCSAKYGKHFSFAVLNVDAVRACEASGIKLRVLGSIDCEDLKQPSVVLGHLSRRAA